MRAILVIGALFVFGSTGGVLAQNKPATAAETILTEITPEAFADIIRAKGFRAELENDANPGPGGASKMIITGMAGWSARLFVGNCRNGTACNQLVFRVGVDNSKVNYTAAEINKWNLSRNYVRAYLLSPNTVMIAYEYPLAGGVSIRAIGEAITRFENAIGAFKAFPFRGGTQPNPAPSNTGGARPDNRT